MITFSKIDGEWMLRVPASVVPFWSGQPVSVSLRNGATKQVTLGECRMTASDNTTFWTVARDAQRPTEVVGDLSRIVTPEVLGALLGLAALALAAIPLRRWLAGR